MANQVSTSIYWGVDDEGRDIKRAIERAAADRHMSMAQWIRQAVKEKIARDKTPENNPPQNPD